MADDGAWQENRKMVLFRLDLIDGRLLELGNKIEALDRHLTTLSVRASVWGGLAGLVMAATVMAIARRLLG